jgi:hypothetical protein
MDELKTDLERAEFLQNLLIAVSTGGGGEERDYKALRKYFIENPSTENLIPSWIRTCRDLGQFWSFIKGKFSHYAERREFIWSELGPLLAFSEKGKAPADAAIAAQLMDFSPAACRIFGTKRSNGKRLIQKARSRSQRVFSKRYSSTSSKNGPLRILRRPIFPNCTALLPKS